MTKHTPGPWNRAARGVGIWCDASRLIVATAKSQADARHIVRCVNAHGDMLAALDTVLFAVTGDADNNKGNVDRVAVAMLCRAAIAKATGEAT